MPKILNTEFNDYQRKFVTIEIEPNEQCACKPFYYPHSYEFYPVDKAGCTHNIRVCRRNYTTGLTGQPLGYGKTWLVGCGSGSGMGWSYGLTLEKALNAARAYCNVIENDDMIASVYFNEITDWNAYRNDKCIPVKNFITPMARFALMSDDDMSKLLKAIGKDVPVDDYYITLMEHYQQNPVDYEKLFPVSDIVEPEPEKKTKRKRSN